MHLLALRTRASLEQRAPTDLLDLEIGCEGELGSTCLIIKLPSNVVRVGNGMGYGIRMSAATRGGGVMLVPPGTLVVSGLTYLPYLLTCELPLNISAALP